MFNSLVETYCVATRNATRGKGITLPEVHGATKGVDPAFKPEHQHKSKKTLLKPVMQPPPPAKVMSNTQIAGNKILKRSVNFLRRDQRTKGSLDPSIQQVIKPEISKIHRPVEESFCEPNDVTPSVPARCPTPVPAVYRKPGLIDRPVTSAGPLISYDPIPVPAKVGTPVDDKEQHLNSPYSDEDLGNSDCLFY